VNYLKLENKVVIILPGAGFIVSNLQIKT